MPWSPGPVARVAGVEPRGVAVLEARYAGGETTACR